MVPAMVGSLPVFGLQFHPEMPVFEWARADSRSSIPRSPTAVNLAHHIAHFFVTEGAYVPGLNPLVQ